MVQRIKQIDEVFEHCERVYIHVRFWDFFSKTSVNIDHQVTAYQLNVFIHFYTILILLRQSSRVYIHSIYMFVPSIIQLLLLRKTKLVLDVHGLVPAEREVLKGKFSALIYRVFERIAFKRCGQFIYVTQAMHNYYEKTYSWCKDKGRVYTNIPVSLSEFTAPEVLGEETVIIYSGNMQQWQNITLMLNCISHHPHPNYRFIILTGELEEMRRAIAHHGINSSRIELASVSVAELPSYYSRAHYGFVLRDDTLLNRVANPTKLTEYLSFGIVPIVKSERIGDFLIYGYEFVKLSAFEDVLAPRKSKMNMNIVESMITRNKNSDLYGFLYQK